MVCELPHVQRRNKNKEKIMTETLKEFTQRKQRELLVMQIDERIIDAKARDSMKSIDLAIERNRKSEAALRASLKSLELQMKAIS